MDDLVERALACYVQPTDASRGMFMEMMLLDSCFIVELLRMYKEWREGKDVNEPILHKMITDLNFQTALRRDLIRVGNQLPFCVILEFLEITPGITDGLDNLIRWAFHLFNTEIGSYDLFLSRIESLHVIQNLLELVHISSVKPKSLNRQTNKMEFMRMEFINYATELEEAGVKFKKNESDKYLFDIKPIKNGVLEIPPLQVSGDMLYDLQNLMEFEKQLPIDDPRPINDYVKFIQCLVNSPNDVKLLRRCGIIDNWLGNDEVIFNRLNELGSKAEISFEFTYFELLKNVNDHCRHRRNVWMANLRRNYFNSPWTFLSLLVAVVLLLLTVIQTVFSILLSS